ncbi:MAG: hypothetical protein LBQ33_00980 [Oscillospiraceae bacterium]|nr:hypothetical protein [Oscillospiraceae bacterium]
MYWVARDGDPTKAQEIFVFRLAPFLGRFYGNERRYRFVVSNITDEMNTEKIAPVGFLQFRPRNDKGEKELRDTVLFFGNMQAGRPRRCVLALKTQAGETEENGYIHMLDSTYLVILPDVGDGRRLVKAEFYSKRDDLLYAYVP